MESTTRTDGPEQQHSTHRQRDDLSQVDQDPPMSSDEIADAYAEVADKLARWRYLDHLIVGRYRRRQFSEAAGRILDVACGTGRNFRYLPRSSEVVGIDISPDMLTHARDEHDRLGLNGSVRRMDAQALDFPADSFDTVISSFSTCTFPDPITALQEMERVCKSDGAVLLLEHSPSDIAPLAWLQDWRAETHYEQNGCRLNHDPLATVQHASLTVENASTRLFGLVTTIDITPG